MRKWWVADMLSPAFRSATDLSRLIRRKELGSEELLDLYLARIERLNPRITRSSRSTLPARKNARARRTRR
jgi:Asp-tRNA(Asn)/Glu-tRNA(Gln) amidotransferase A subunit family amidase